MGNEAAPNGRLSDTSALCSRSVDGGGGANLPLSDGEGESDPELDLPSWPLVAAFAAAPLRTVDRRVEEPDGAASGERRRRPSGERERRANLRGLRPAEDERRRGERERRFDKLCADSERCSGDLSRLILERESERRSREGDRLDAEALRRGDGDRS